MNTRWLRFAFAISTICLLLSCGLTPELKRYSHKPATEIVHSEKQLLMETEWLAEKDNRSKPLIIDYGRKPHDYEAGHIPDAVFVDRKTVWNTVNGIPGMLPSVEIIVAKLEKAGISNENTVIIYDAGSGLWASRLFWALEYLGHRNVHILNGGWNKWLQEKREIQMEAFVAPRGHFSVNVKPSLLANKDWVLDNLRNPAVQIVDSRSAGEYTGEDIRAARGGHIPGAVNINWISNLTHGDLKTILPKEKLSELYESLNISKDKTVITYCQTGVRGAHTYFALRLLGYTKVQVYDGSWAEWGNNHETPVEKITEN